jgi:LysR family transcriptional regulator, glycine cleavage system transcriptional activator
MTRRLPPLGSLRAFEAAARQQSFKRAAAELGVTPTAISHQIRQLEAGLGVALFLRQTRKVMLTAEGRALYPALREAFDAIAEAVDAMQRRPVRQSATLSATVAFTAKLLVPRVGSFRARHPGWDLRLHASDDPVDLHGGEADAAIRYGRGDYRGMTVLPLLRDNFAPVCSPHLPLRKVEDLPGFNLIHFDWGAATAIRQAATWQAWKERAGLRALDAEAGVTFNDEASAIDAAIAGQGVALPSLAIVASELASGALIQPFGPLLEGLRWDLVYPAGAGTRPAVTVLREWVMAELSPRPAADDAER